MPFWSRKKKPYPETIEALEKVKGELEKGAIYVESETWRIMANKQVLRCIFDDIENERITPVDASIFKDYNEMARKLREELMNRVEKERAGASRGDYSDTIVINAPMESVWNSWRDMEVISQTILDGSAGRIDGTRFWIKRVTSEKRDIWLETYEEIKLIEPTSIVAQKIKIEVQAFGMDSSLQEIDLEGQWMDYTDFKKIAKNRTRIIFRTTFTPSDPITDYGKVFLSMFTQTTDHPTMKEEIAFQLKKFKEILEN